MLLMYCIILSNSMKMDKMTGSCLSWRNNRVEWLQDDELWAVCAAWWSMFSNTSTLYWEKLTVWTQTEPLISWITNWATVKSSAHGPTGRPRSSESLCVHKLIIMLCLIKLTLFYCSHDSVSFTTATEDEQIIQENHQGTEGTFYMMPSGPRSECRGEQIPAFSHIQLSCKRSPITH